MNDNYPLTFNLEDFIEFNNLSQQDKLIIYNYILDNADFSLVNDYIQDLIIDAKKEIRNVN